MNAPITQTPTQPFFDTVTMHCSVPTKLRFSRSKLTSLLHKRVDLLTSIPLSQPWWWRGCFGRLERCREIWLPTTSEAKIHSRIHDEIKEIHIWILKKSSLVLESNFLTYSYRRGKSIPILCRISICSSSPLIICPQMCKISTPLESPPNKFNAEECVAQCMEWTGGNCPQRKC